MKVFISWSGELSKRVAEELKEFLLKVIPATVPFISTQDIPKGSLWLRKINEELEDSSVGIICLTHDNVNAPWILFEAGALAKGLPTSRVCPLLVDFKPAELGPPLNCFHATEWHKADLLNLITSLHGSARSADPSTSVRSAFIRNWPNVARRVSNLVKKHRGIASSTADGEPNHRPRHGSSRKGGGAFGRTTADRVELPKRRRDSTLAHIEATLDEIDRIQNRRKGLDDN